MSKIILTENEKEEISNQYDDIDRDLFYFLVRRGRIKTQHISTKSDDYFDIDVMSFEGYPGYSFTTFMNKKEMTWKIYNMLAENNIIENFNDSDDDKRGRVIRTIRKFLNFILPKK